MARGVIRGLIVQAKIRSVLSGKKYKMMNPLTRIRTTKTDAIFVNGKISSVPTTFGLDNPLVLLLTCSIRCSAFYTIVKSRRTRWNRFERGHISQKSKE